MNHVMWFALGVICQFGEHIPVPTKVSFATPYHVEGNHKDIDNIDNRFGYDLHCDIRQPESFILSHPVRAP